MPLEQCWAFFSDPGNLAKITPPELGFRIKSDVPAQIYPGLLIRYTVSPIWNIPLTWVTEITQVQEPHFFVDEQRLGPYRLWHHEHFFRALDHRETEMRDLVHYVPPLWIFGGVLNRLVIVRQLAHIFDFRAAQLSALFAPGAPDSRA